MMNIFSLIAAQDASDLADTAFQQFQNIINIILPVLMSVLLVIGMFYGITLGVKYAKAEEDDEKKKAKSSLINVIVGVCIAIVFIAVVQIILNQGFVKDLFWKADYESGL